MECVLCWTLEDLLSCGVLEKHLLHMVLADKDHHLTLEAWLQDNSQIVTQLRLPYS